MWMVYENKPIGFGFVLKIQLRDDFQPCSVTQQINKQIADAEDRSENRDRKGEVIARDRNLPSNKAFHPGKI